MKNSILFFIYVIAAISISQTAVAFTGDCNVTDSSGDSIPPYEFQNGTPANAIHVNKNFECLYRESINQKAALESQIQLLENKIDQLKEPIVGEWGPSSILTNPSAGHHDVLLNVEFFNTDSNAAYFSRDTTSDTNNRINIHTSGYYRIDFRTIDYSSGDTGAHFYIKVDDQTIYLSHYERIYLASWRRHTVSIVRYLNAGSELKVGAACASNSQYCYHEGAANESYTRLTLTKMR